MTTPDKKTETRPNSAKFMAYRRWEMERSLTPEQEEMVLAIIHPRKDPNDVDLDEDGLW